MSEWAIYPAIDLRAGRVVRLAQGDPARETRYSDVPLEVAHRWQADGAEWLHVVNLDGAFGEADENNQAALKHMLTTGLRVQFGGGLRDLPALQQAIDLGVRRVVIGTAAIERPELVEQAVAALGPERVAVALDARQGMVQTHGWRQASTLRALDLARRCADQGVRWLVYTDISRDGMGSGLDLTRTVELHEQTGLHVIASGGVRSLEDVRRAYQAGLQGAVLGRALYQGQVLLPAALEIGRSEDAV